MRHLASMRYTREAKAAKMADDVTVNLDSFMPAFYISYLDTEMVPVVEIHAHLSQKDPFILKSQLYDC